MEIYELHQMQSLPLEAKIIKSQQRIREWYEHWDGNVYVSFSGGKDSTVLLHLARQIYPDIEAVFVNSAMEFPEIRQFVKTIDNVTWLRPKRNVSYIFKNQGYPVINKEQSRYIEDYRKSMNKKRITGDEKGRFRISKKWQYLINAPFKISDRCCYTIKKSPIRKYELRTGKKPILGTMASESNQRKMQFIRHGCNAFDLTRPRSAPLFFWLEEDIWEYIYKYNVSYSKIYDMGYKRTGCMFCMFGVHLEKSPNRFEMLKQTHPKQWKFCIEKLGLGEVLDYLGITYGKYRQLNILEYIKEA